MPLYAPGDLVFVRGTDLTGRLISRCTRSPYTHVRGIIATRGTCIEAVWPRIAYGQVMPGDEVVPVRYESDADRAYALATARGFVGHPYSLASLLSDLGGYAGFPWSFDRRGAVNCCELWAICLGIDPRDMTPGKLHDIVTTTRRG